MAKTNIEVRIKQKTLSVKNRKLKLEDNFEGAGVFIVGNIKNETILELSYRKRETFSSYDEGESVYKFISGLRNRAIEIRSTSPEDYEEEVFPAVMITGKFNAIIYR